MEIGRRGAREHRRGSALIQDVLPSAFHVGVIFHLAAAVGVGQSMYEIERYVDANTRGTAVLLDTLVSDATIGDGVGTERAFTACSQPGHQLFSPGRT